MRHLKHIFSFDALLNLNFRTKKSVKLKIIPHLPVDTAMEIILNRVSKRFCSFFHILYVGKIGKIHSLFVNKRVGSRVYSYSYLLLLQKLDRNTTHFKDVSVGTSVSTLIIANIRNITTNCKNIRYARREREREREREKTRSL